MTDPGSVVALVLAAGTARRFGGTKVIALLDGRPLLAHVLAAVQAAGIRRVLVVVGRDAAAVAAAMRRDAGAGWPEVLRLINPSPDRGLSSTVRFGLRAARAAPGAAAVMVLPGDQPLVRPEVISALLAAVTGDGMIAVVPRHAADSNPNPVLLLPAAWPLVDEVDGDRGFGPLLALHADRVLRVDVPGSNPDVDTPADLAALRR